MPLTENQKAYVTANYSDMSNVDIAAKINATVGEIRNFARLNKLKKSEERKLQAQKEISHSRHNVTGDYPRIVEGDRKDYIREYMKMWRAENRDRYNKNCQKSRENNREKISTRDRARKQEQRKQVIAYYSNNTNKCACCGYSVFSGLTIDHINGGGRKHTSTKGVGMGASLINWLVQNNYPTGFQILCANCNRIKGTQPKCNCGVKFS